MGQYPLSWIYYLTFIFLTAFVFLNMMIGAILEVMSEEKNAKEAQTAHDERGEIVQQLQAAPVMLAIIQVYSLISPSSARHSHHRYEGPA